MTASVLTINELAPIRCVVYLRISRDDIKKGRGVHRQLERCKMQLPKGWVIVMVIDENDTSATKAKPRPKYEAMLAAIKAGEYDAVMAYAQDRLTRKGPEAEALLDLVDNVGLRVATSAAGELRGLKKGTPEYDPDARAAFRNSTTGATREVEWIGKRVTDEAAQRAQDGRPHGAPGFGFRRVYELDADGSRIGRDAIDEAEAAVIRQAAHDVLNGVSVRAVTQRIEAGSIRPRRSGHWSSTNVRLLLLRASNAGLRVHRGTVLSLEPVTPAILSVTEWQRLTALLTDPSRQAPQRGKSPRWLLSGVAVCGRCGGTKINVQTGGKLSIRPAYTCTRLSAEHPGCWARSWVDEVDAYVGELITERLADPQLGEPGADVAERIETLDRQVIGLRNEQDGISRDTTTPRATRAILAAEIEAEIKVIEGQIKALLPSVQTSFYVPWGEATLGERRAMIEKLTSRIELHPPRRNGNTPRVFIPTEQVVIKWRAQ